MKNKSNFFGFNSFTKISEILNTKIYTKILVVSGNNINKQLKLKNILPNLLVDKKLSYFFCNSSKPSKNELIEIIDFAHAFDPDAIIAIGGGKIIDLSKLLRCCLSNEVDWTKSKPINFKDRGKKLIVLPTTAGTGSENTKFSVLYIDNKKYSIEHKFMKPDITINDPSLCFSSPYEVAVSASLDSLSQAIESFWSINSTVESRAYSVRSIRFSINNIENAILKKDKKSIAKLCLASHFSGKAINIAKTTAPHALSYSISRVLKIPHGYAVALSMPSFLEFNSLENSNLLNDAIDFHQFKINITNLYRLFDCKNAKCCSIKWISILQNLGLNTSIREFNLSDSMKQRILEDINSERLKNNPINVDKNLIEKIIFG